MSDSGGQVLTSGLLPHIRLSGNFLRHPRVAERDDGEAIAGGDPVKRQWGTKPPLFCLTLRLPSLAEGEPLWRSRAARERLEAPAPLAISARARG